MHWAFDYLQRNGEDNLDEHTWLRDETGGAVYLRLTTRPIEQPHNRRDDDLFHRGVIDGAYWWRKPTPNTELVIVYQGCVAPEAIEAAGRIGGDRRDVAVLAVTSSDRLQAGWFAAQRERRRGNIKALSHVDRLMAQVPSHAKLVTVTDGHPATLGWLGSVRGHTGIPLGVEHFGQTGTVSDLYKHFGIDADAIVTAAQNLLPGPAIRGMGEVT